MKIIMNKDMFVFFMWDDDNKIIFKYSKRDDINQSSLKYTIKIPTRILISSDLAFFATVVGKINMSGCWCHQCILSAKGWSEKSLTTGMLWSINLLKKYFDDQILNKKLTSYEEKVVLKIVI